MSLCHDLEPRHNQYPERYCAVRPFELNVTLSLTRSELSEAEQKSSRVEGRWCLSPMNPRPSPVVSYINRDRQGLGAGVT